MLYNNLKALAELKKKGKKVGKLRYKYGKFRGFMNQSGFKIETGNRSDRSSTRVGEVPIRMPVEGRIKQGIIRYGSEEWFALICVEETETPKKEIEIAI